MIGNLWLVMILLMQLLAFDVILAAISQSGFIFPAGHRLNHARYIIQNGIGLGSFGEVYKATDTETDSSVAIKISKGGFMEAKSAEKEAEYASLLCEGGSGSIQWIDDFRIDRITYAIVFELMACDLKKYRSKSEFSKPEQLIEQIRNIARDILPALKRMKDQGIVHADIKDMNVLVDEMSGRFMMTDYGIAGPEGTRNLEGTPVYISPEIYSERLYSTASDMWAFGVMLLSYYLGRPAFTPQREDFKDIPLYWQEFLGEIPPDLAEKLNAEGFQLGSRNTGSLRKIKTVDADLYGFLNHLLDYSYRTRMTVEQAIIHPFVTAHNRLPPIEAYFGPSERGKQRKRNKRPAENDFYGSNMALLDSSDSSNYDSSSTFVFNGPTSGEGTVIFNSKYPSKGPTSMFSQKNARKMKFLWDEETSQDYIR